MEPLRAGTMAARFDPAQQGKRHCQRHAGHKSRLSGSDEAGLLPEC